MGPRRRWRGGDMCPTRGDMCPQLAVVAWPLWSWQRPFGLETPAKAQVTGMRDRVRDRSRLSATATGWTRPVAEATTGPLRPPGTHVPPGLGALEAATCPTAN